MIINGDSLHELKNLEDNSIDAVITDPPYGYSFMGKDWDKAVPSVEIWQECLRVLKPGAFACVMSAPRSDVQQAMTERLIRAGFRLDFTPIYWTYASGFPKAGNIGKLVDKRLGAEREVIGIDKSAIRVNSVKNHQEGQSANLGLKAEGTGVITAPSSDQAKALDGSYAGFQPKPAVEVVIIAMKPLSEKTYVDQALKNGKGITWLDDCRVPTSNNDKEQMMGRSGKPTKGQTYDPHNSEQQKDWNPNAFIHDAGRFPANLLVSDDVLNDGVERKSGGGNKNHKSLDYQFLGHATGIMKEYKPDSGSYSRYFDLDAWARERLPAEQAMTFPFAIFPKASKSEKNKGLEHLQEVETKYGSGGGAMPNSNDNAKKTTTRNVHPTVKPLRLMSYLITLFSREGDTVLDPFVGSGTTAVAAEQLGRKGIGIEREEEYAEIARARVENVEFTQVQQPLL